MDPRQLRYFLAAADAGSISRAAERCRVAQPSISQQIKRLENRLGVVLFDRLARGVALTDAGHALLPRARQLIADLQDIESAVASAEGDDAGRLALGAIPTMAPYLVPPLVAELRAERPRCRLSIREDLTQNLVEAVVDSEIDLAITSAPIENPNVEIEVVAKEPLFVVAPAGSALAAAGAVALPDLRDQPAVTLHEMHCLGQQVREFCAARRLASNVVCRMTQIETLLEFVRLGLGVSILPAMTAAHDHHPERAYLPFKASPPSRPIAVIRRAGRTPGPAALRLVELLKARLRSTNTSAKTNKVPPPARLAPT